MEGRMGHAWLRKGAATSIAVALTFGAIQPAPVFAEALGPLQSGEQMDESSNAENVVAEVLDNGVVVASYGSLPEAVGAATDGQTVKLASSFELEETLVISKRITLDLNGFDITTSSANPNNFSKTGAIKLTCSATIAGPGSIKSNCSAIQVYGWTKADIIEVTDCIISSSSSEKATFELWLTTGSKSKVTLTNCELINSTGGKAFEKNWNDESSVVFEGCNVKGMIRPTYTAASEANSKIIVDGGFYSNGDGSVFENANTTAGLPELAKHLVIKSGYFKVEPQSELVSATSSCVSTGDADYPFRVVDEGQQGVAYTLGETGDKVFHSSLEGALKAAKGSKVYLLAPVEVSLPDKLLGADIQGFPGSEIKYNGNLSNLLLTGCRLSGVKLTCTDAVVLDATASSGALSGGTSEKDGYSDAVASCVADGYLLNDGDGKPSILPESDFVARVGKLGYPSLVNAITVAGSYEESKPANEVIVLLESVATTGNVIEVMAPSATFTLDLNGKTLKSENGSGLLILPNANGANITVKNGNVDAAQFGIATNGSLSDVHLALEGVTVNSHTDGWAGVYLPAVGGETTVSGGSVTGSTGIEVRGGSLTVKGAVEVRGTAERFSVAANGSGTTTQGAGVAVSQHTTKDSIKVEFVADERGSSPTVEGVYGFYESNPQKNPQEDIAKVSLSIKAGSFTSTQSAEGAALYSEDCKGFVSGGSFSTDPKDYLADGYKVSQSGGSYVVAEDVPPAPPSGGGSTTPSDKTEVEHNQDGSTTTTVTKPDGSQTITHETATGTESVVKKDPEGNVTSTEVSVSKQDAESGKVELPIDKSEPAADASKAPEVEVKVPATVTPDKPVQVTVPVAKAEGAEPNHGIVVYAVDAEGNETVLPKCTVDKDGNVVFEAAGDVTIKVVDAAKDMPDVTDADWFAGGVVDFATARGIVNGVDTPSGKQFQGYGKTSRGMLVAMLHNLELNPEAASDATLPDIPDSAFYADAAAWALGEGILSGVDMPDGSKEFQGDAPVTREQVAVFLMRYAESLGMDTSKRAEIGFPDAGEVSGFAKDAMSWAVAEGLFKGDDVTHELNPADGAARAEVAAVIMRFISLMYA